MTSLRGGSLVSLERAQFKKETVEKDIHSVMKGIIGSLDGATKTEHGILATESDVLYNMVIWRYQAFEGKRCLFDHIEYCISMRD